MTTDTTRPPIWAAIAGALRAEMGEGARRPGDRLPSEAQLSARFGVNRHTVRRALAALAEDGLVHARRGAGVFVIARPTEYPLGRRVRFHRNLAAAGRLPERRMTSIETRPASQAEASALTLLVGDPVVVSEGVSLSDGRPIALFRSAYPAEALPGLAEALAETSSVTRALSVCGIPDYVRASSRLTAVAADASQSALLELPPGAALIRSVGVNTTPDGRPVEYGITHFAGERVTLTLDHS